MKITCTQENLARGLQLVSHVASKNITLPILNNVLLKAEGGALQLLATNLEIGVSCHVRGKVEREGAITVPAKTLHDYVNLLPRENVELELVDQTLHVRAQKSKTAMKGIDASDFPLIPEVEVKSEARVAAAALKDGLTSVAFAVAIDETRPEISGVYFNFSGSELTLVATDSYRLAEKKVTLEKQVTTPLQFILPARTVQELVRIAGEADGAITIQSNENQSLFTIGETKLTSRLIEGQYPDYRQIIPGEREARATVSTGEFTSTVKRASLFCKQGSNDIKLTFSPAQSEIVVTAANLQVGESEARQEATVEGKEGVVVFNYRYVLDGLQNISSEECLVDCTSATQPGVLRPKGAEDYLYIIMPIKQ